MDVGNKDKLIAFTLAEVLITLGIIGVVAALTIPTLVTNYQKQEYVSKLRKTYTMLNQAFMKYAADQGCVGDLVCTGLFSNTTAINIAQWDDFFNNYLKVAKNCGMSTGLGCFQTEARLNNTGTDTPDADGTIYKVILLDGQSLGFSTFGGGSLNCNYLNTAGTESNSLYKSCGSFVLDVNGAKGPNKGGKDYFGWDSWALNSTHFVVPMYGSNDFTTYCGASCKWSNTSGPNYYCGTSSTSNGNGCASRIMEEGWEMNY